MFFSVFTCFYLFFLRPRLRDTFILNSRYFKVTQADVMRYYPEAHALLVHIRGLLVE